MIDLKQKEFKEWQERNFPASDFMALEKEELVDKFIIMKLTLGISEEAGEVCHHVLKGIQGIRGGKDGIDRVEVADGIADILIFSLGLLTLLGIDAEREIERVMGEVLSREWRIRHPQY